MTRKTSPYLESSVGGDQSDESLDDEAKEESKASDVEIPLGSEAPHIRLHLNIQMTGPSGVLKLLLLAVILLHLPDCVQEEQYEDGNLVSSLHQSCSDS